MEDSEFLSTPFASMDHPLTDKGFLQTDSQDEPALAPALRLDFTSSAPSSSSSSSALAEQQEAPQLSMLLQPLRVMHRPVCLARMQAVLKRTSGEEASLTQQTLQAINRMQSPAARALAKAEQALQKPGLPNLHFEASVLTMS